MPITQFKTIGNVFGNWIFCFNSNYPSLPSTRDDFLQSEFYFNTTNLQWEFFDVLTSYRSLAWTQTVLNRFSLDLHQFSQRFSELLALEEKLDTKHYGLFSYTMITEIDALKKDLTTLRLNFTNSVEMFTKMESLDRLLANLSADLKSHRMTELEFSGFVNEKHSDLFHELATFEKVLRLRYRVEVPELLTRFISRLSGYFAAEATTEASVEAVDSTAALNGTVFQNGTGEFKADGFLNVTSKRLFICFLEYFANYFKFFSFFFNYFMKYYLILQNSIHFNNQLIEIYKMVWLLRFKEF